MGFQRGVVPVLLIDEEACRVSSMTMHEVHQAARLLPGGRFQLAEDFSHFGLFPWMGHPRNCQYNHTYLATFDLLATD